MLWFCYVGFPVKAILCCGSRSYSACQCIDLIETTVQRTDHSWTRRGLVYLIYSCTCVVFYWVWNVLGMPEMMSSVLKHLWLYKMWLCFVSILTFAYLYLFLDKLTYSHCFRLHREGVEHDNRSGCHHGRPWATPPPCWNCNDGTFSNTNVMVWFSANSYYLISLRQVFHSPVICFSIKFLGYLFWLLWWVVTVNHFWPTYILSPQLYAIDYYFKSHLDFIFLFLFIYIVFGTSWRWS